MKSFDYMWFCRSAYSRRIAAPPVLVDHYPARVIAHVASTKMARTLPNLVNRTTALVLNVVIPGTGLLLRSPSWLATVAAVIGMVGWTLLVITWVSPGNPNLIPLGWFGLLAYVLGAVVAAAIWLTAERPSSRDIKAIGPLFTEIAQHYLRNDLPAAELGAKKLVSVAASEPGAWRLLGIIHRAQGASKRAQRDEQRADRLEAMRNAG